MVGLGRPWAVSVPALLLAVSANAATSEVDHLLTCAAHFKARAQWLEKLDRSAVTAAFFDRRSDVLLQAADQRMGPSDWRMSTGNGNPTSPPTFAPVVESRSIDELTRFAELGFGRFGAPLCVEDETCNDCTHLLSEIVK